MAWTTDRMRSMEASRRRGLRKMAKNMSASIPGQKMFKYQGVLPSGWDRKCLPQDEYEQFRKSCSRIFPAGPYVDVEQFVCNCGQYCLF